MRPQETQLVCDQRHKRYRAPSILSEGPASPHIWDVKNAACCAGTAGIATRSVAPPHQALLRRQTIKNNYKTRLGILPKTPEASICARYIRKLTYVDESHYYSLNILLVA